MRPVRLLQAAVPAALFLAIAYRTVRMIFTGTASASLRSLKILGNQYDAATSPSQFRLVVVFHLIAALLFGYLAWWAYNE